MIVRDWSNIKAAREMVKSLNAGVSRPVFCPLLGENCRKDCASFEEASLIENLMVPYGDTLVNRIIGYRCTNKIVNEPYEFEY